MGTDTLVDRVNGQTIDEDWFNIFNRALSGTQVGRNSSGIATSGQDLGTSSIPFGTIRATTLILDGSEVDVSSVTALPNRVISGAVRSSSDFPDYIRCAGVAGGANFDVLGASTNLSINVAGIETTITTDINESGLTVAPGSNNTANVNDTSLTGQYSSRFQGEDGAVINIDAVGSEITSRVGQYAAFKNTVSGELFYAFIEDNTTLTKARRGFFFDDAGDPIERAVMSNNDSLQLLSTAWIFADADGTTIDVTYITPIVSGDEPTGPASGDYWYDTETRLWKRYSGSAWVEIDRTFIGYAVLDTTDCIGARPEHFGNAYGFDNTCQVELKDVDTIQAQTRMFVINLHGNIRYFDFEPMTWNAATDFESGVSRTVSTYYYLYLTEDGSPKISDQKPYDERGFMKGFYHPFESWRYVGKIYNTSGNEFEIVDQKESLDDLLFQDGYEFEIGFEDGLLLNFDNVNNILSVSGDILLSDGKKIYTAAGPSVLFDDTGNTLQITGCDILDISRPSTSLSQKLSLSADGYVRTEYTNSVGTLWIGVERAASGGVMTGATGNAGVIVVPGAYSLQFGTNDTPRMTINSSGNIGIGTSDIEAWPSTITALELTTSALIGYTSINTTGLLSNAYNDGSWKRKASGYPGYIAIVDGGLQFLTSTSSTANSAISWTTPFTIEAGAPTNSLYVDSSGNVGIGTSSPVVPLQIKSTSAIIVFEDSVSGINGRIGSGDGLVTGGGALDMAIRTDAGNNILFAVGATEMARINSSGSIGIGTSSLGNMAAGQMMLEGGVLAIKEITTPTADSEYGKWYTKTDNQPYFQDGAGTEKKIESGQNAIVYRTISNVSGTSFIVGSAGGIWEIADDTESEYYYGSNLVSESNGVFSFSKTGYYKITFYAQATTATAPGNAQMYIAATTDNSGYNSVSQAGICVPSANYTPSGSCSAILKISDISNDKFQTQGARAAVGITFNGNTSQNLTYVVIERLGDI